MTEELLFWIFLGLLGVWIANSSFLKKDGHFIMFRSSVTKTQMDFLLFRKEDRVLCKDCKVIPSESLSTQHKLLVMDLVINKGKKKRSLEARPRIKWGSLTLASALEIEENLKSRGAWESRGGANSMWETTASCIRETAREVLDVSREEKDREKKLYRLAKARKRRARNLDQVKCIKEEDGTVLVEDDLIRERRIKVEEVKEAIRRIRWGRATGQTRFQ
ncbi:uncharacterized protein LOC107857740 [Capsicum annuum]|uniref:uncharacterized protein LOC107857740 n=1 Tax=Capsicum annuum TaxID=4072 RepID=UPI0007BECE79|nr:uncharacterized protein LOC107857740 [Capsicum annuum]